MYTERKYKVLKMCKIAAILLVSMYKHPVKRRWKDVIRRDLKDINMDEGEWCDEATTSRAAWRASCGLGLESYREQMATEPSIPVVRQVTCEVCSRTFRRESD